MKAIVTKYHCPGYTRGSRISATDSDRNRVYISLNPEWNNDQAHIEAARALIKKMGWKGAWIGGGLSQGRQVFVPHRAGPDIIVR